MSWLLRQLFQKSSTTDSPSSTLGNYNRSSQRSSVSIPGSDKGHQRVGGSRKGSLETSPPDAFSTIREDGVLHLCHSLDTQTLSPSSMASSSLSKVRSQLIQDTNCVATTDTHVSHMVDLPCSPEGMSVPRTLTSDTDFGC